MNIKDKTILITSASSGIGRELALQFSKESCTLLLVGRNTDKLKKLGELCRQNGAKYAIYYCELSSQTSLDQLHANIMLSKHSVDILINNAGVSHFASLQDTSYEKLEEIYKSNVLSTIYLSKVFTPAMKLKSEAMIVNIGSTFGSISFPFFSAYSSSKFAVRGFTEALRRELQDSNVSVLYIAPRATKTKTVDTYLEMAKATDMQMDEPELVASKIIKAIKRSRKDLYIGFPECIFVKLNAILPRLVDKALLKQSRIMAKFAKQ